VNENTQGKAYNLAISTLDKFLQHLSLNLRRPFFFKPTLIIDKNDINISNSLCQGVVYANCNTQEYTGANLSLDALLLKESIHSWHLRFGIKKSMYPKPISIQD